MPRDTFVPICVLCTRAAKPNGYCDPHDRQYGPASTAGLPARPRTKLKPPKGGERAQRVRAGAAGLAAMKAKRDAAAPPEERPSTEAGEGGRLERFAEALTVVVDTERRHEAATGEPFRADLIRQAVDASFAPVAPVELTPAGPQYVMALSTEGAR